MSTIISKLLILLILLAPIATLLWLTWSRRWREGSVSECLLAAGISLPILLIAGIFLLGVFPWGRPLLLLPWLQIAISVGCGVAVWRRREEVRDLLKRAGLGIRAGWQESGWPQRAALLLGLTCQCSALLYGAWNSASTWDELAYHIPQAVQPYQDGRLATVQANRVWADSYPRGAALLYFWTLSFTHSDVGFHPVNASFGFLFIVATYVSAIRLGLGRGGSWMAAGLVSTAPIFWFLGTVGYIDLSVATAVATVLAMSLNERQGSWSLQSCIVMLLAAILALWMKFPPVAIVLLAFAYRGLCLGGQEFTRWRRGEPQNGSPRLATFFTLAAAAGVMASVPYLRTWYVYGTPVYPLCLRVGPVVLFPGPMDTSGFQRMNHLPTLQRYSAFWTGWYEDLNTDSPGGFGALFLIAMVPAALVCLISELRTRNPGWIFVGICFWIILILPEFHVPRYALYVLLPGAMCAVRLAREFSKPAVSTAWTTGLLALGLVNVHATIIDMDRTLQWQSGFAPLVMSGARNRPVYEEAGELHNHRAPLGRTRHALYEVMKKDETLVAAVDGLPGLLYDYRYRYRVEHRPAKPWPYGFVGAQDLNFGAAEAPAWRESLLRDQVAAAIVYTHSAEDGVLRDAGSGYQCVYEQTAAEKVCGIRIYRRQSP